MSRSRARANGEGSIFPYRNGFAAYAWVRTPAGDRKRKYVYGPSRDAVHAKWVKLLDEAGQRPVATKVPTLGEYLTEWLRDVVEPNLAALVKTPRGRSRKAQAWSSEEARRFLESARDDGDRLYALYVLVLVLGMRKGEVLGLRWEDVDLDAAQLTIELQLQRVRRQLLHRETKTE